MARIITPKTPRIKSDDWRNLPVDRWNTRTFHAYFIEKNREMYGVEYAPMRNWSFKQAQIKRAIDAHGAELLKRAFDECFRTYRPTRDYPILTAGFAVSYRINAIIPKLRAEEARVIADRERGETDIDAVKAWL